MFIEVFVFMLFFDSIFDPANKIFAIKEILFILVFIIFTIKLLLKHEKILRRELMFLTFIAFLIFSAFCIGLIRNINYSEKFAMGFIKSFLFLVLLPVSGEYSTTITRAMITALYIMAISIILIYVVDQFWPNQLLDYVCSYLTYVAESAKITTRQYGQLSLPMIYFKTSPLLIFAISHYIKKHNKKDFIRAVISLSAMVLSGTRANILVGIFFFLLAIFIEYKNIRQFILFMVISATIFILPGILSAFFLPSETSNMIKTQHFHDYLLLFDLETFLFGQGIGSGFKSTAVGSIVYNTELTYFEILRVFGLPLGILLVIALVTPTFYLYKNRDYLSCFAYLMYLLIAGTNPLLISSTGMISIIYSFVLIKLNKNRNMPKNIHAVNLAYFPLISNSLHRK